MLVYNLPPNSMKPFTASAVIDTQVVQGNYIINQTFDVARCTNGSLYYLERVSFHVAVSEPAYIGSMDAGENIPKMQLINASGLPINGIGLKLISPLSESPLEIWEKGDQDGVIRCRVTGLVRQTAELIGVDTLRFALSISGYEMTAANAERSYRSPVPNSATHQLGGFQ